MLFPDPTPPPLPPTIELRCGSCESLAGVTADLMIADPPWTYARDMGGARPTYACLTVNDIRAHLAAIHASRLALWITWPLLPEWSDPDGYRLITGGAWVKSGDGDTGHYGPGYHWAGCSEPMLIYTRGAAPNDRGVPLRNAWVEPPGEHSAKPIGWMVQMIRRWVPPGGLVVDPYAGDGCAAPRPRGIRGEEGGT